MYRILVVEDDPGIAQAVCAHLRQWELEARCVQNFRAVMDEFTAFDPQLVLLDISLPFFNGYHWCTRIRAVSRVPVVFLSSASENMNIVMAMNMGADDFIAKPFDLDVLTAKVQALLWINKKPSSSWRTRRTSWTSCASTSSGRATEPARPLTARMV